MELQRLTSLKDIKIGDCFTIITPDFEDVVIQFVGRNPMINNEEHKSNSGYFATVYGPKKCFILEEDDLKSKDTEYYIGYNEKFALERRIENIQNNLLAPLKERLLELEDREFNSAN
jgi:hypothetical protein